MINDMIYILNQKKNLKGSTKRFFLNFFCEVIYIKILKPHYLGGLQEEPLGTLSHEAKFQQDEIYEVFYSVRT